MNSCGRPTIIVSGFMGLFAAGGVSWDYLQYPLGFYNLKCDVYYLEDTGLWPIYNNSVDSGNCESNVKRVRETMSAFGLDNRWIYRDERSGSLYGMSEGELEQLVARADVLVNVSCSLVMRKMYMEIPVRILVDSDPMFTQIQYEEEISFTPGESGMRDLVRNHTHHFSFGENIGKGDCIVPLCGVDWTPTRQPICLEYWKTNKPPAMKGCYTTVMNWSTTDTLVYRDERWGQKDVEFMKMLSLPQKVSGITLAVAVSSTGNTVFPVGEGQQHGWKIEDPEIVAGGWQEYREFVQKSEGEFSVAKETYVKAKTGWFSCRSACYLAAGRPVVAQETGWSSNIPQGLGLIAFNDIIEASEALIRVNSDSKRHGKYARELAVEYFDSDRVLIRMLEDAGLTL